MWRNQRLTIEHSGKEITIYDDEKLILEPLQAKSIGINTQVISPYEYQIYTFTFENGTQEEVTLNLLTKQGEEKLEKYIDFETNTPKIKFESIDSKFIMSKDRFEIKYIIWK